VQEGFLAATRATREREKENRGDKRQWGLEANLFRHGRAAADRCVSFRFMMLSRARSTAATATALCRGSNFLRGFSTSHEFEDRDVVIVGGGPAGLALASALGMSYLSAVPSRHVDLLHPGSSQVIRSELKMTVVDAGDFSKIENWSMDANKFSNRVSSLTNDSCRFLEGALYLSSCLIQTAD